MHGDEFPRSLRLRATSFARSHGEGFRENRKNFARNHDKTPYEKHRVFANSGFTIIEVALVLAIAGLIFLVVFLALPALQKSQRDTARRQDVAKAVAAVQQYFADGGDAAQATFSSFAPGGGSHSKLGENGSPVDQYLKSAGLSPNISRESIRISNGSAWPDINMIELWPTHKCGAKNPDGSIAMTLASNYDMAVVVRLEAGNINGADLASAAGAVFYCADAGR